MRFLKLDILGTAALCWEHLAAGYVELGAPQEPRLCGGHSRSGKAGDEDGEHPEEASKGREHKGWKMWIQRLVSFHQEKIWMIYSSSSEIEFVAWPNFLSSFANINFAGSKILQQICPLHAHLKIENRIVTTCRRFFHYKITTFVLRLAQTIQCYHCVIGLSGWCCIVGPIWFVHKFEILLLNPEADPRQVSFCQLFGGYDFTDSPWCWYIFQHLWNDPVLYGLFKGSLIRRHSLVLIPQCGNGCCWCWSQPSCHDSVTPYD